MPRFDFLIRCTLVGLMVGAWLLMGASAHADEQRVADKFEQQLAPILQAKCGMCHSNRAQEAELDLSTFSGVLRGGESGSLLDAEHPEKSLLWTQIESGEMPPDDHEPLNTEELDTIKQWVLAAEWVESVSVEKLDQHDVLPFLLLRCARCHGQQVQRGNLDVRSKAALLKGGESGPAIVAGEPDESLILKRIHAEEMPPREDLARYSVKPMELQEVELLTRWIAAGAPVVEQAPDIASRQQDPLVQDEDRSFWAFRPAQRPRVPVDRDSLSESSATTNAIDAFIQRRLRDANLRPSPRAAPVTLIRRAYFDLHGLPPSREAVRSFEEDFRARGDVAFVEVIDRLLASPRYAERWADYWLDLAGYSDSEGVQHSDPVRPHVWRYRDYVIRSFADDKPYDQFLREQVAGDELADYESADEITQELSDNLVATAFLKLAPDGTFAGITGFVPDRLEAIDDSLEVLSSAVMGLTIRCARCHSHKFDPIPQRDYYRLSAVFKGALDEHAWLQPILQNDLPGVGIRRLPFVPTAERKAWESHEAEIDRQLETLKSEGASEEQIKQVESKRRPEPMVRALWDNGDPSPTYLLRRGNYLLPDRLIGPGVPSVLTDGVTPFEITQPWPNSDKSGRRLAFANWLVQPDHPLTARVMANRIWRHHFGIGIVSTLDDFGKAGSGATHPDLLDWLSVEFVRRGWSVKQMHRLIMTSQTWQQSSVVSEEAHDRDPENRWLSRVPMRKSDAEALRDSMLFVADRLSFRRFGPADSVSARADGLVVVPMSDGAWRRSIYVQKRRTEPVTLLSTFDRPSMNPNCIDRSESTVAPQALHLMNDRTVYELSESFADRVLRLAGDDQGLQIRTTFELALAREPNDKEITVLRKHLETLTRHWIAHLREMEPGQDDNEIRMLAQRRSLVNVCHTVFNSAAFLYID